MKTHPLHHAFEITEEDVEVVLRANSLKVANTNGMSFEAMAEMLLPQLDTDRIALVALGANDMDDQTTAAHVEIHRQLWAAGVVSVPPSQIDPQADRQAVIDRLAVEFTGLDPLELQRLAKEGYKGLNEMTDRDLICEAWRFGVADELAKQLSTFGMDDPAFVHGHWTHIFGPGKSDTTLRIVYSQQTETLIAAQFQRLGQWIDLRRDDLLDVEDSLKNANPEALECPASAGLEVSYHLPDWAQVTNGESDSPNRHETQRG